MSLVSHRLSVPLVASCCFFLLSLNIISTMGENVATYEDVKAIPQHPGKYLIDVRNTSELDEGKIPASINVPLPELEAALEGSGEEFKAKYGREKPAKDVEIIFSCRSGKRASAGNDIATKLGYKNTKIYEGSWLDWAKKEGL